MHAKLFTRDKRFVVDLYLPPFTIPPEGIMWGQRFFVLDPSQHSRRLGPPLLYTEGLLYYVADGMPPAGVGEQPTHELWG